MTKVQKYLLEQEWSMGNGQCPDCCGNTESWLGHPLFLTSEKLGHEKNCPLAEAMVSAGLKPLYQGKSKLKGEYEMYINEGGIFSTRPKNPEDQTPNNQREQYRNHRIKLVNNINNVTSLTN